MLQRSISASSLLKQAAAAVQAQQSVIPSDRVCGRPGIGRAASDFITSTLDSRPASDEGTSALPSASSSGVQTPSTYGRRHIHFNNKVEQCIAVDIKEGDEEDEDNYNAIDDTADDDSSDDGVVMMKRSSSKARLSNRSTPRNSFSCDSRTIAMLPSTTLKYREDTSDSSGSDSGRLGRSWNSSKLSPSPSQETLRPSKPSANFLIDDEDDDEDMSWEPSGAYANQNGSVLDHADRAAEASNVADDHGEHSGGLRRTPSGMFMPYEEDEDDVVAAGLFGKVVDTVNTAKDIAHVIWNVGWRR